MKNGTLHIFLMSPPALTWQLRGRANFRSRQGESQPDALRARREWSALADAIVEAGGHVVVVPPHPSEALTGMIYTAEAGELYRDAETGALRWIMPQMAVAHRVAEADWIGGFLAGMGCKVERVSATWEAQGDAIRVDGAHIVHTYGSGPDARSVAQAYGEVAHKLSAHHMQLQFDANPWFHGNTFLNIYHGPRSSLLMVCEEAISSDNFKLLVEFADGALCASGRSVEVMRITRAESLGYATNALQVGETVLSPLGVSERCAEGWRRLGLEVKALDLGELFGRGGGAPVCLTCRLWGMRLEEVPAAHLWAAGTSSIEDFTNR